MRALSVSKRAFLGILASAGFAGTARAALGGRTGAPVLLLKTRVAGECYYSAADAVAALRPADPLLLRREPGNRYDKRAIEVLDVAGRKLGYLPRHENAAVARMMDAGETMQARVTEVDAQSLFIRFDVEWARG